ncbi:unnamed protein product [Wuchereria bancrofti]|uniref:Uncharacterized protein n=1 Tax=Wuchereria bancrofti TaxID=6293 RepID=A0A3P7FG89_WUCBA|nr:unnamed protein product [Wuchereria bancrofti]
MSEWLEKVTNNMVEANNRRHELFFTSEICLWVKEKFIYLLRKLDFTVKICGAINRNLLKINEATNYTQNAEFSGAEFLFVIIGILIVLFFTGAVLVYNSVSR